MRGLLKALKLDATKRGLRYQAMSPGVSRSPGSWQRRLRTMAMFPRRSHVLRFISETAKPACLSVAEEWRKQGYVCNVEDLEDNSVRLSVGGADNPQFIYEVRPHPYAMPSFVMGDTQDEDRKYFRAEGHHGLVTRRGDRRYPRSIRAAHAVSSSGGLNPATADGLKFLNHARFNSKK
jgi:choline/glycine/proline betaine transport protein